ncbi:hypothetical protein F4678DRAFT_102576 [Xylaria arbuscula]|nr:hypothetical protein F4678DRAFT_102576 [Xylaria arbuscula]
MADADYFLDLSSPDPLAEEVPSSVRPVTRRITKSQHDLSSFPLPQSSPRRQSRAQSPRKRTFQLDVGDERSPQRIRVTVEAEEALKDHAVNRKLFPPPSSPTRSPRRRETITTTTVPLNDEAGPLDGPVSTPQKRGRPRRTSNGTPMPRGRKRAGTPIQRKSKQARQDDEPSSATGTLNDASIDIGAEGGGGGEETPKPKTRARKTPKKPPGNTPLPSSQASGKTTGRKRGRPRKVPLPEESTVLTGDAAPSPPIPDSNIEFGLDSTLNTRSGEASSNINAIDADPTPTPPRQSNGIAPPSHLSPSQVRTGTDRPSASPASSHQDMAENEDFMMSEDYQGTEPQSDLQSVEGEDGLTNHGQDTIADASEFSMIAVESLPSFQASFQASFHEEADRSPLDQHEMGEETSRIINQTLESLRHSLRTEEQSTSHAAEVENDSREVEDQNEDRDGTPGQTSATTNQENRRGLWSSPRRVKNLPLSRQVFVGRGNVNDSFSSIPDSILHAATPGRPPVKPTTNEHQLQGGEDVTYNDSFSEVPEAVLEAATPRPLRQMETSTHISPERSEEPHETTLTSGQRPSLDYGSGRLPTPEETSSSNAGSGKAHDEDPEAALETEDQPGSAHRTDVPSSPPIRTRPRALDFGYSNLQHELNTVQERLSPSPQRQPSGKVAANQVQSLEAPLSIARPSLSPIVRVGRTLQNVMSDNSSPENREVNLGSPFRGSASSDHPHQSLGAGSSSPSMRSRRALNNSQLSAGSPTRLDPNFRYNLDRKFGRVSQISGEIQDPAPLANDMSSRTEPLEETATHQPSDPATLTHSSPMHRAIRMSSNNTDGEASWAAQDGNFQRIHRPQPSLQTVDSHEPDAIETRGTSMSTVYPADTDLYLKQDHGLHDEPIQDIDEEFSDKFAEHVSEDEDNGDDIDIWDIEASRASPNKPEPPRTTLKPLRPDVPSSRRSKVPSPWRRNNRRLIYKDDIASSSQIEIEESSQSEVEQYPPVRSRQRSLGPQPQKSPQRQRSPDPVPVQKSMITEDLHKLENTASPSPSHDDFEDYAGLADSEELDDVIEHEEPVVPEQHAGALDSMHEDHGGYEDYGLHEDQKEHDEYEELEDLGVPTAPEASINISEYSLVAQPAKQTPKESKKPKSGFFGKFDILSFFSSPAVLPTDKSPGPNPSEPINKPAVLQPALETRQLKEPPRALWSTGLFPSVPQRGDAGPSSERRTDLFSPGSALRSTDTVADTYEPSTSVSPSPSRSPSVSAVPLTPERQDFPPIEQKRNFTPRLGQSRGSLFTTSQPASSTATDEANSDIRESSDEQESSALTEGSEYERVPPREKPSQWDRNLSPTKSCFRSPLKPTTPGRIVAFSNSALSPLAQVQTRDIMGNSTNASNSASQGPTLRAPFEGKENQPHPHTQQITNANNNFLDKIAPQPSTALQEVQQPRALTSAPKSFALSRTTWSRHHWSRLDEMLQLRRRDPLRFQQVCALPPRDNRRSSVLLGKEVTAQDAHLILEQWHLDVVEAFKLEVGGWDEDVLAKRVFALVIGEEKRRAAAQ